MANARGMSAVFELLEAHVEPGRRIPLLGVIAAGQPLPASQILESIEIPGASWNRREVFALRVRGSSMIEDGILDGDYLVVEPRTDVRDGQTVVAEVDGQATVKRLYRERDGSVRLQPANDRLLPLVVRAECLRVRGVVVGVLRKQGFRRAGMPVRARQRVRRGAADGAADLAVRILEQNARQGDLLAARVSAGDDVRALARSLRALHATYVATKHPRLRQALLDEAAKTMRQLRALVYRGR